MDLTSPVIIATILGIVFTQVIGRFVDHHYGKNYRMLERNLQLKKLLGEESRNASLDELIRRQLNSYVLYEMGGVEQLRKRQLMLFGIGIFIVASLMMCIATFQNGHVIGGIVLAVVTLTFISFYYERKSTWFKRVPAENTKYRAELAGGNYGNNHLMIDVMASGSTDSLNTLDYPFIYVEDASTGMLHSYKRVRSSGTVSVSSGEDTDLVTEYTYHNLLNSSVGREDAGKNPIVSSLLLKSDVDAASTEVITPVIVKPLKGAVSFATRVTRYLVRRLTK